MSHPKAMLSQLTDLDDSELDEQAGVFGFRRNEVTPSSKLFFNPASVFLDVPDYRDTVNHNKRFTSQPVQPPLTPNSIHSANNTGAQGYLGLVPNGGHEANEGKPHQPDDGGGDGRTNHGFLNIQKPSSRGSERQLSVELSETQLEPEQPELKGKRPIKLKKKNYTGSRNFQPGSEGGAGPSHFASSLASKVISRQDSDMESYNDSDGQEEYMYNLASKPSQQNYRYSPNSRRNRAFQNRNDPNQPLYTEDTDTDNYNDHHFNVFGEPLKNHPTITDSEPTHFEPVGGYFDSFKHKLNKQGRKSLFRNIKDGRNYGSIPPSHISTPSSPKPVKHQLPRSKHFIDDWHSEDEALHQVWNMRYGANSYQRRNTSNLGDVSLYTLLVLLTILSLGMALYSMSTIPLVDVSLVSMSNILAAENELAFDIHIRASNWNLWTIKITDTNLGIYATPQIPKSNGTKPIPPINSNEDATPVVPLGTVLQLQEPLVYPGSWFWQRRGAPITMTALVRLPDPGKDPEAAANKTNPWLQILKGPYDLTVRGSLRYSLLYQPQIARICAIQLIEPSNPDHPPTFGAAPVPAISCVDDDNPT